MLDYEELRLEGIKRNLPVLYNLPKWEYINNSWRFIPSVSYVNQTNSWIRSGSGQKTTYYIPELNKSVNPKRLVLEIKKLGITERQWYNKHILGFGSYTLEYPYCIECKYKILTWKGKISHGYSHLCSKSCNISRNNRNQWLDESYRSKKISNMKILSSSGITGFGRLDNEEMKMIQSKAHSHESKIKWKKSRNWYDSTGGYFGRVLDGIYPGKELPKSFDNIKSGDYISSKSGLVHYRSSYELETYKILDNIDTVETYKVEPFYINYTYKERIRRYYPDILVILSNNRNILIEVKPESLVSNEIVQLKSEASIEYCNKNNMKYLIITEYNIFKNKQSLWNLMKI